MKVLKEGIKFSIEKTCTGDGNGGGGCHALLLVEAEDIGFTSHSDISGDTDYYFTFKCCSCGVLTDIPDRELPTWVKEEARTRRIPVGRINKEGDK